MSCLEMRFCRTITASSLPVACISWACLLPQELPFAAVARLLGWQTHEEHLLSDTTIRTIVRAHGQIVRQAEQAEVTALLQQDDLATLDLQVVPHDQPRRRVGWPVELNTAVEIALAAEQVCRPTGVSWADWNRGKRGTPCGCDPGCRGSAPPRTGTGAGSGVGDRR
jgi:hypothetical protein